MRNKLRKNVTIEEKGPPINNKQNVSNQKGVVEKIIENFKIL